MRIFVGAVSTLIIAAVAACRPAGEREYSYMDIRESPSSTRPGTRTIADVEWDTVLRVGGSESDTLLYDPAYLAADGSGIYLYDGGRRQVGRFASSGEPLWWFGGRGAGPDEFQLVRDIELDEAGNVWVLDVQNARISVLSSSGAPIRRVPLLDVPRADQVIPLPGGRGMVLIADEQAPLALLDAGGAVTRRLEHPWPGWREMPAMASQSLTASQPERDRFVVAFRIGNGFVGFGGESPMAYHGVFVEHTEFPRLLVTETESSRTVHLTDNRGSANSLDIEGDRLYIQFEGMTRHRNALIDIYDVTTGNYVRSVVLPRRVSAIAIAAGTVYALYASPYPVLIGWRPSDPGVLE